MIDQTPVRVGTRGSLLARRQTDIVLDMLRAVYPDMHFSIHTITTSGDLNADAPLSEIASIASNEGLFTSALEEALLQGEIDLAVHSLKDLPIRANNALIIGAIPPRGNPADALVTHARVPFEALPQGAVIGTSSRRRAAQLLHLRPDLVIRDIRGNVDTRIRKTREAGEYDGTVLAAAGLERIGRLNEADHVFALDALLPAPGQAALAVQCRRDEEWLSLLEPIHHMLTAAEVLVERDFLRHLGGGCALPVAAYGVIRGETLALRGRVISANGEHVIDVSEVFDVRELANAGALLAHKVLTMGASALLEDG